MADAQGRLLEREDELLAIELQLDHALEGDGSLVVVEGPAGIGKTRLLQAAVELAGARAMTVLRARGGILERHLEYGVVRQLIEGDLLRAASDERSALLGGGAAAAGTVIGIGEPPQDTGAGYDPSNDIVHGLHWLVANMAERGPLLLVIDDAHWSDAASMRAGGYVAQRLEGLPVAFLVSARDDEPGAGLTRLADFVDVANTTYLRPRALSTKTVGELLAHAFEGEHPPDALVRACVHSSAGNPFFLTELAADLAAAHRRPGDVPAEAVEAAGPLAVRKSLLTRLARLGPQADALARAVATLGGESELRHAAALAELGPEDSELAAVKLADAGILEHRRPLRMAHPLVRAAVTEATPAPVLARLHRRAFGVLRADGASDEAALAHALNAEPSGDADLVALLRRTAGLAARTGAPEAAAVHLARALAEPPREGVRPEVLAELGRAHVRAGAFGDGLGRLNQALGLLSDPEARATVHRDQAFAAFASAGIDEARRLVQVALTDPGGNDDDALQLEADLALLAWLSGAEHGLNLDRHRSLAGATRAERTLLAVLAQEDHSTGRPPGEVVELAQRALGGGRLVEEDTSESLAWYMATYALLTCEALPEARVTIEHALAEGHRRGSVFARAGALGCRAVLALNEGRPRDAEADARTAAAGAIPPIMVPVNASYIALALVEQGELQAAEAELRSAGLEHGPGGPTVLRWIPWARARLHEAQGRPDAVAADVSCLEEDDRSGRPMRALAWQAVLARALTAGGESPRARELATEHLRWARAWDRPGALGVAMRAAALAGPSETRVDGLQDAVATLSSSPLCTEEARARADLGIALLRGGRRREGRQALEPALELAVACGARDTAATVAAELEVAGAPARKLAFDELTASERRVAELAAAGGTNREIARELFVTPKTVENQLTRVYAKLGIGDRRALNDAL